MKLITVEEHYASTKISDKIKKIFSEQEGNVSRAVGDAAPGVADLGETRIAYMDERKIDTQIISYASGLPATMEKEYAVPLCREVNDICHFHQNRKMILEGNSEIITIRRA